MKDVALRYMRMAGFVHRDVSTGNCLWHAASSRGKLSDIEYARPFDELIGHDPRTVCFPTLCPVIYAHFSKGNSSLHGC